MKITIDTEALYKALLDKDYTKLSPPEVLLWITEQSLEVKSVYDITKKNNPFDSLDSPPSAGGPVEKVDKQDKKALEILNGRNAKYSGPSFTLDGDIEEETHRICHCGVNKPVGVNCVNPVTGRCTYHTL